MGERCFAWEAVAAAIAASFESAPSARRRAGRRCSSRCDGGRQPARPRGAHCPSSPSSRSSPCAPPQAWRPATHAAPSRPPPAARRSSSPTRTTRNTRRRRAALPGPQTHRGTNTNTQPNQTKSTSHNSNCTGPPSGCLSAARAPAPSGAPTSPHTVITSRHVPGTNACPRGYCTDAAAQLRDAPGPTATAIALRLPVHVLHHPALLGLHLQTSHIKSSSVCRPPRRLACRLPSLPLTQPQRRSGPTPGPGGLAHGCCAHRPPVVCTHRPPNDARPTFCTHSEEKVNAGAVRGGLPPQPPRLLGALRRFTAARWRCCWPSR